MILLIHRKESNNTFASNLNTKIEFPAKIVKNEDGSINSDKSMFFYEDGVAYQSLTI